MDKRIANKILMTLDRVAAEIEKLGSSEQLSPRLARDLVAQVDGFSDKFEVAAFGEENLRRRQAKVFQSDKDEPYMSTFDKPFGVHQSDPDEPYMSSYDVDQSHNVTERDEHKVRDLNPYAEGTKRQPSWARGPAGPSTRQGSSKPKQWAP